MTYPTVTIDDQRDGPRLVTIVEGGRRYLYIPNDYDHDPTPGTYMLVPVPPNEKVVVVASQGGEWPERIYGSPVIQKFADDWGVELEGSDGGWFVKAFLDALAASESTEGTTSARTARRVREAAAKREGYKSG